MLGSSAARAAWVYRGMRRWYRARNKFSHCSILGTYSQKAPTPCAYSAGGMVMHDAQPSRAEKGTDRQP